MSKISQYTAITNVESDDLLVVVDVNDDTMAPTGTTKKMTLSQLPTLLLQATTGVDGFELQDGTPTIISWTAPDDGNMHRVAVFATLNVTSATTGGQINIEFYNPGGVETFAELISPTQTEAGHQGTAYNLTIGPDTTFTVYQESAVTEGTAYVYAEIWGS